MSADVVSEGTYYDHHTATGGHTTSGGRVFGVTPFLYEDCARYGCKPMVVIDPEEREQVEPLARALRDGDRNLSPTSIRAVEAAIRSLIAPPRPEEPTGFGAVVEDATGAYWTLYAPEAGVFINYREGKRLWSDIAAVRVLTQGRDRMIPGLIIYAVLVTNNGSGVGRVVPMPRRSE